MDLAVSMNELDANSATVSQAPRYATVQMISRNAVCRRALDLADALERYFPQKRTPPVVTQACQVREQSHLAWLFMLPDAHLYALWVAMYIWTLYCVS